MKEQQHIFTNKMLRTLLIPVIFEQVLNSLMGTVDTMMVSNVGSAASAENAWITNTLMESTRDTADIAAEPTLLTIMVSTVPIREFSTCSKITGINRVRSILFVKICCC